MFRFLLLLPAVIAAIALPVSPALAGEDEGGGGGGDQGSATLSASQGCVSASRARAAVTGDNINRVAFYVDGELIRRVTQPNAQGRFAFSMRCSRLSVGAHRASAVVTFTEGTSPARQTLRFQITRSAQVSPRHTG